MYACQHEVVLRPLSKLLFSTVRLLSQSSARRDFIQAPPHLEGSLSVPVHEVIARGCVIQMLRTVYASMKLLLNNFLAAGLGEMTSENLTSKHDSL